MKLIRNLFFLLLLTFTYATAQITPSATADTPVRYLDPVFTSWTTQNGQYQPGYDFTIYKPQGDSEKKVPVIFIYPGGGGDISEVRGWCEDFVRLGYITVAAEYKNSVGEFTYSEQVKAVINTWILNQYFRDHSQEFGIKKKKMFEFGISAGGITALQSGIALDDKDNPIFGGALPGKSKLVFLGTASLSGAAIPEFQSLINLGDPPNFFYNGMLDPLIKFSVALQTYEKEISYGIPANMMAFPDKGHKLESHDIIYEDLKARFYYLLNVKN